MTWLGIRSLFIFFKMLCSVITAVIYFRSAYCDVSMPPEGLREFLPRLIPVCLTSNECMCTLDIITDLYIPHFF
jgi:hypothetical protein